MRCGGGLHNLSRPKVSTSWAVQGIEIKTNGKEAKEMEEEA